MLKSILTALMLSMNFETGYVPQWSTTVYKTPAEYSFQCSKNTFYATLSPRFELKGFFGSMDLTYYASPVKKNKTFNPYRAVWSTDVGYSYKIFTVGYRHHCEHSVIPMIYQIDNPPKNVDGSMDNIYIKVSFSNRQQHER